ILKQGFNELTGGIVIDENIRKEIIDIADRDFSGLLNKKKYEVYKVGMHIKLDVMISDKLNEEKIAKIIELKENVKKEIRKKYQSVEINCIL
ncbi:MAG: hypothetical protein HXK69_01670, partial [Clostridiales bacterium]|nr:hypothetical protein [Clostridiales bacterium]